MPGPLPRCLPTLVYVKAESRTGQQCRLEKKGRPLLAMAGIVLHGWPFTCLPTSELRFAGDPQARKLNKDPAWNVQAHSLLTSRWWEACGGREWDPDVLAGEAGVREGS